MTVPVHYVPPEVDFSTFPDSDGQPMAEIEINLEQMIDLILQLKQPLEPQGHHVGGNLLMYYDPTDGRKHLSPDVFVALGAGLAPRASWKTWVEGKFPEVIFEVASPSTQNRDIGEKVTLYTRLGTREYYIFDPAGELDPAFRGYQIRDGRAELLSNPTGTSIVSPLLGLELRVVDGRLRVIDPARDVPYPLPAEERAARQQAQAEAREAQAEAREAQARAGEALARAEAEAAARAAVEDEVARLRAEIARLREGLP
jgi:Uma2 family endonuclease